MSASLCLSLNLQASRNVSPSRLQSSQTSLRASITTEKLAPCYNSENSWGNTLIGLAESAPAEGPEEGSRGIDHMIPETGKYCE